MARWQDGKRDSEIDFFTKRKRGKEIKFIIDLVRWRDGKTGRESAR